MLKVRGSEHRAKDIWSHPACRVGDKVVVLGKVGPTSLVSTKNENWFRLEKRKPLQQQHQEAAVKQVGM